eukprot:1811653-Alexandrium_andersonii.AAC.1
MADCGLTHIAALTGLQPEWAPLPGNSARPLRYKMRILAKGICSARPRTAENTKCFGILPITCPRNFKQQKTFSERLRSAWAN